MNFQRALVVEDYPQIVYVLRPLLRSFQFSVEHAGTLDVAMRKLSSSTYDLVVLDRNLPDGDGVELLSMIGDQAPDTKILMLTERNTVSDRVEGLRNGADDYIAKPFSSDEFIARVESVMRRARRLTTQRLELGTGALLLDEAQIQYKTALVQLSKKEAKFIALLVRHPRGMLSREKIAQQLWTADKYPTSSSIDTFVKRLRDKLYSTPILIKTRYNLGYELSYKE